MKASVSLFAFAALASVAIAETPGKDFSGTSAAPQECWYGDSEWNVSLWGTYAFTATEENEGLTNVLHQPVHDKYLGDDHAWGGGVDMKYFWHKYFGFGVEGFGLDAKRRVNDVDFFFTGAPSTISIKTDHRAVGGALGTFTFRYPIGCTRCAPYAWVGGGGIFGGGQDDNFQLVSFEHVITNHSGSKTEGIGQFGGGFEVRITRHIGWMNDFSWNVVDGPHNNFGMIRSGLTVAF